MRVVRTTRRAAKGKPPRVQVGLSFVGTGWCVVADRYLVTAYHVLNGGKPRDPANKFYVFSVPGNGNQAFHFPVTAFPLEDEANDLAILEIGPPAEAGHHIPPVAATLGRPPDGTDVLTYGFPAPAIAGASVNEDLDFLGGQFFLKGHANEGIVAAQYDLNGAWIFEFNVGWHHGESGGPVFQHEPLSVFAVMQHYRNIESPHGIIAGPHRGRGLDGIRQDLASYGVTIL